MQVQYVYDEHGKKTGVIVPISPRERVSGKIKRVKSKGPFEPSRFRGIYRNLGLDFERELTCLRQEWERT